MSYMPSDFASLAAAFPTAPDTYLPAQPGTTAVVVECAWSAGADAPTMADVRCDYPAVFAWRVRPPTDHSPKLTVEPVLAYSPQYARVAGQGVAVAVLVPDDNTPGSPLRSRRHSRATLDDAKRSALAEARACWHRDQRRAEMRAAPVQPKTPAPELLAA